MKKLSLKFNSIIFSIILGAVLAVNYSYAFCGFYVAQGDSKIFNKSSKVVLVRDGEKTVISMSSDFKGDVKEFAIVVPVPTFIEKEQIHIGNQSAIDHLDAFSAPRLVEYYDDNPCHQILYKRNLMDGAMTSAPMAFGGANAEELGVTIEATYTVGEYDILILSAKESDGLLTWLNQNNYKIPNGAEEVLGSYIKQNMKFFVAKVNLKEMEKIGFNALRPIQVAYSSPKFMLPIRLGTVNADGDQDMFVFTLTKNGRVESTNYRTVKMPEATAIPEYIKTKSKFADLYKAAFEKQYEKENKKAVFLEYAWDMSWCDPCASPPLSNSELKDLGVFWVDAPNSPSMPGNPKIAAPWTPPAKVFLTRLHVRYNKNNFPEDLTFQETGDSSTFQVRYIINHPWTGGDSCKEADEYRKSLPERFEKEAKLLSEATGWSLADIRKEMNLGDTKNVGGGEDKWWKDVWK